MPSTKASVNSTKNTLVKPMLRKIYDTHKKWLGGDHKLQNPKRSDKDKIAKVVVRPKTPQNIEVTKPKEAVNNLFMDSSVESNVTVVEVNYDSTKATEDGNKLRIVINNFDKILDEYGTQKKKETRIPKLQKSKTCSIIESKCILKKSNSQPLNKNESSASSCTLQHKTKSMGHIDQDVSKFSTARKPKGEIISAPIPKVKEVIQMMDNIAKSAAEKERPVVAKPPLSKAVSTYDLSSRRSLTVSKIPVKASLRKTYPSTPSGLDRLDYAKSSTKTLDTNSGSTLGNKAPSFSRSVQNLSKKMPKKDPVAKINGKLAKSVQNLNSEPPKLSVATSKKNEAVIGSGKSMQNLTGTARKTAVQAKETSNLVAVAKNVGRSTGCVVDECIVKSTRLANKVENLVAKTKEVKTNKPKVVTGTQVVKSTVEKFETTCDSKKKRYETYKKEKPTLDAKTFVEKKPETTVVRSDTYKIPKPKEVDIFKDREIEHEFVRNEQKNVTARNKINDIISSFESKAEFARIESELSSFGYAKIKEYNSDDNSDDSGNISNEQDCDELARVVSSGRSRSSSSGESILVSDDSVDRKPKKETGLGGKLDVKEQVIGY